MATADLASRLTEAVGAEVTVQPGPDSLVRVDTPFHFSDGDHLVIRLRSRPSGGYEWTDLGHTFMHLSYFMDIERLEQGRRGELLEETLRRNDVEDRDGELVLQADEESFGHRLLTYAQALIQISDLEYLSRERVRSTFLEDFRHTLSSAFPDRAHFDYIDQERDAAGRYPIDCLLNGGNREIAVFALPNEEAINSATITLWRFRNMGRRFFSTGIFEDQEGAGRKPVARLSDVIDKQFSALTGNEEDVVSYLNERLGE